MTRRTNTPNSKPKSNNVIPYRSPYRPAIVEALLLTIERAIADGLTPTSLRQVADNNTRRGSKENDARLLRQADNLLRIADKLELLGFRGAAGSGEGMVAA